MTKSQFLGLRRQGFTLQFVSYGEDIKAKIGGFADAKFKINKYASTSKVIKVKKVDFGEDVRLAEASSFADFECRG